MQNLILAFPNRVDSGVLSGGNYAPALPLINLQNRVIGKIARTFDATLPSTQFDMDLVSSRVVRVIAIRNHNFSIVAKYRIRGSTVADFATNIYDSGWTDVWPTIYPYSTLEWEDDAFWTGKYSQEEIAGYTTELDHILPGAKIARYWRVEIDDTANTAGYLNMGRVFIGPAWQPSCNPEYNDTSLGWEPNTDIQTARGGTEYFQKHSPFRVAKLTLNWLTEDEAFAKAFEIQRRAGIDQELVFIHDPDDVNRSISRRFMCRMRQLSSIEYPYFSTNKTSFELKEIL